MKIQITYEYLAEHDPSFWAKSKIVNTGESVTISTCGNSWDEVRRRHLEKLQRLAAHQGVTVPYPEEVEV